MLSPHAPVESVAQLRQGTGGTFLVPAVRYGCRMVLFKELWILALGSGAQRAVRAMPYRGGVLRVALEAYGPISWPIDPGQDLPDLPPRVVVLVFDLSARTTDLAEAARVTRAIPSGDATRRFVLPVGPRDCYLGSDGNSAALAQATAGAGARLRHLDPFRSAEPVSAATEMLEGLAEIVSAFQTGPRDGCGDRPAVARRDHATLDDLVGELSALARTGALDEASHIVVRHVGPPFDAALEDRVRRALGGRCQPVIAIRSQRRGASVSLWSPTTPAVSR